MEKVASKREQRVLAHFAEREQLKTTEGGLILVPAAQVLKKIPRGQERAERAERDFKGFKALKKTLDVRH